MLIYHSEKFALSLANNIDTENNEPVEVKFLKENFGNHKFVRIATYYVFHTVIIVCVIMMRFVFSISNDSAEKLC